MPWTPSAALAPSLQTLWEPRVAAAAVSTDTADANLMRRVPSAPTERLEGLGKADKHMAGETESHLSYIFGCETM